MQWFAELLWPARCIGCRMLGSDLCTRCLGTARKQEVQRLRGHAYLDALVVAAPLKGIIETAVYALKYRGMRQLAVPLGDWTAGVIGLRRSTSTMFGANPLIVPVPLHVSRLRERDYNQAALLARRLSMIAAMPLSESVLVRLRNTGSQVRTYSRIERLDNMRGAFSVTEAKTVTDRDIVLVDDVCTTGATLEDCARALKESGARSVSAIVLARG